jgi:hypothetical protein
MALWAASCSAESSIETILKRTLRGRRGTDVFCTGHAIGDRFVWLNAAEVRSVTIPLTDRNVTRDWKTVGIGELIGNAVAVPFVSHARDLMPNGCSMRNSTCCPSAQARPTI